jgi:hypothetical protein
MRHQSISLYTVPYSHCFSIVVRTLVLAEMSRESNSISQAQGVFSNCGQGVVCKISLTHITRSHPDRVCVFRIDTNCTTPANVPLARVSATSQTSNATKTETRRSAQMTFDAQMGHPHTIPTSLSDRMSLIHGHRRRRTSRTASCNSSNPLHCQIAQSSH